MATSGRRTLVSLERRNTMFSDFYSYTFMSDVDMEQVEEVLVLATMAAEGLHGRSRIHLDATFESNPETRTAECGAGPLPLA